jgi:hypothetical protein
MNKFKNKLNFDKKTGGIKRNSEDRKAGRQVKGKCLLEKPYADMTSRQNFVI